MHRKEADKAEQEQAKKRRWYNNDIISSAGYDIHGGTLENPQTYYDNTFGTLYDDEKTEDKEEEEEEDVEMLEEEEKDVEMDEEEEDDKKSKKKKKESSSSSDDDEAPTSLKGMTLAVCNEITQATNNSQTLTQTTNHLSQLTSTCSYIL